MNSICNDEFNIVYESSKKTERKLTKRVSNSMPVEMYTHLKRVLLENLFSFYYFAKIFYLHISLHENELSKGNFLWSIQRSKRHGERERGREGKETVCTQYDDDALGAVVLFGIAFGIHKVSTTSFICSLKLSVVFGVHRAHPLGRACERSRIRTE